uniref:Deoxyribonuclease 1 like 4, tandem duplicate 1 n=1 Tax=Sinocyclocheilus rhinocerous TaxID=307959 RepID=A0A673MGX0_9TELE
MKVTTFNIQKFGKSKLSDLFVLKTLIKVSIIVILEVVDSSGDSVDNFPEELNKFNKTHYYTLEINVVDTLSQDDQSGDEDAFAREPYVLRFKNRSDKNFHWLITDDVDTITRSWYIDDMLKGVVLNCAKPFNFQKAYKLKKEDVNKNNFTFELIFNHTYQNVITEL